jgi:uncharacterized membrane protein affecting hemolysin expression
MNINFGGTVRFDHIISVPQLDGIATGLSAQIEHLKGELLQQMADIKAALENLTAKVQANTDVEESAITLIKGLAAQLKDMAENGVTADELNALADQVSGEAAKLGAAVVENTTAA